jgi:hypothetical protein
MKASDIKGLWELPPKKAFVLVLEGTTIKFREGRAPEGFITLMQAAVDLAFRCGYAHAKNLPNMLHARDELDNEEVEITEEDIRSLEAQLKHNKER